MRDQDGQPLRVETCPCPQPVYFEGQRLPASYANFYIANRIGASSHIQRRQRPRRAQHSRILFPDREIIGIACRDLVLGLGTLHCMTQQQPK